jgi:hypothetical protein
VSNYQDNLQETAKRIQSFVDLHRSLNVGDRMLSIGSPTSGAPRILYASDLEFVCGHILELP